MTSSHVSVVVPTHRRPKLLERCLRAILAQRLAPGDFEVLVVDDGRDGATRSLVRQLRAEAPGGPVLRYLRPSAGRGPAVARNAGWREARAPIVAFTDDDTVPEPDWLAEGLASLARHGADAVAGGIVVPRAPVAPTDHARMTIALETAEFVTANAFVRRSALASVGGFDERFGRPWREDTDLQFSLLEAGGRIVRAPAARVEHPVRPERWGVSLRQQKNAFYEALLYKKHPQLYRHRVLPGRPLDFYGVVACTLLAAIAAALGQAALACTFLVGGLLLVGAFVARRLRGADHRPSHVAEMVVTSLAIPFLSCYWRLRGALHFRVWYW